jgi:glycosyltransferase involved in cell wall biosynthesis
VINYSIIIGAYNEADWIGPLLDSIPRRDDVEVLLVDDHSDPEQTAAMRRRLAERRFPYASYLANTGKQGLGTTRNVGIAAAQGKWLVFADADDSFTPAFAAALDRYAESSADQVLFLPQTAPNPWGASRTLASERLFEAGDAAVAGYRIASAASRFVKRELVERRGIRFSEVPIGEDTMFSVQVMVNATDVRLDHTPIYTIAIREGSLYHRRRTMPQLLATVDLQLAKARYLREHVFDRALLRKALPSKGRHLRMGLVWHGPGGLFRVWLRYLGHGLPLSKQNPGETLRNIVETLRLAVVERDGYLPLQVPRKTAP